MSKNNIPTHVGLIMDGNRRWAKENNLTSLDGHLKGYGALKNVVDWFFARGVKTLSFFAFSTENWKRSEEEVGYLMKLIKKAIIEELCKLGKGYRIVVSGRINELPDDLPKLCREVMEKTKDNTNGTINVCLNYGGRAEIIDAAKKMIDAGLKPGEITEENFSKYLYHPDLPELDLIVRTSGEQHLSGFLLWESAYSEIIFLKKYWPDFSEQDVEDVLTEYNIRSRRFGG